jgi:Subtilisin inhibitor-like
MPSAEDMPRTGEGHRSELTERLIWGVPGQPEPLSEENRMTRRIPVPLALIAAAAGLFALAPASAADEGPPPDTSYLLLVAEPVDAPNRADLASLTCDPAGGTHPHAASACRTLTAAKGRFEDVAQNRGACPMVSAPVRVRAYGHWHGRAVHYQSRTYGNRCEADLATGGVFGY